jgi:hypothetical protein
MHWLRLFGVVAAVTGPILAPRNFGSATPLSKADEMAVGKANWLWD